jgi:PEGA domain
MKRTSFIFLIMLLITSFSSPIYANPTIKSKTTAQLRIMINVSGTKVFLDNRLIETETAEFSLIVKTGIHSLRVVKDGYADFSQNVDVASAGTIVKVNLQAKEELVSPLTGEARPNSDSAAPAVGDASQVQ